MSGENLKGGRRAGKVKIDRHIAREDLHTHIEVWNTLGKSLYTSPSPKIPSLWTSIAVEYGKLGRNGRTVGNEAGQRPLRDLSFALYHSPHLDIGVKAGAIGYLLRSFFHPVLLFYDFSAPHCRCHAARRYSQQLVHAFPFPRRQAMITHTALPYMVIETFGLHFPPFLYYSVNHLSTT